MVVLYSSGPNSFLNCFQVLIHLWCYNERYHGKGSMDGIGRTLKNCVYRDVMPEKYVIGTSKLFVEHADTAVKGITSLHFPANVLIEPEDIEASPRIKDNFQIHIIKWSFDGQNVPNLQFFKMATNEKPFFSDNFMGNDHQKITADDHHCGSCLRDYEPAKESLQ